MKTMVSRKTQTAFMAACFGIAAVVNGYDYDPNDFATQVVIYNKGTDAEVDKDYIDKKTFTNPNNALGRPTVDTTGDIQHIPVSTQVPVVPVYSPFRSFELVTIGYDGWLILKFDHKVRDDENNLYGIDFIVFGNAQHRVRNSSVPCYWTNGNPNNYFIYGSELSIEEPSVVSVSQDGVNWYSFSNGPYADSFAATLGRVYDPNDPNESIGAWNLWWGEPTNPTLPLDPSLTAASFAGMSVAAVAQIYGRSAGGGGFDIANLDPNDYAALGADPNSGRKWIQYVRIDGNDYKPEIDAVADVSCCGDWKHPFPAGDINKDCRVDYEDLAILCDYWLTQISGQGNAAKVADLYGDNIINFYDMAIMADNWFECSWECE